MASELVPAGGDVLARIGFAVLDGGITLQALFAIRGRRTLAFCGDYLRPAPFQRRARALERGRVPVQVNARSVALLLPERGGPVMRDCRLLMASCGRLVAGRRSGHPTIMTPTIATGDHSLKPTASDPSATKVSCAQTELCRHRSLAV